MNYRSLVSLILQVALGLVVVGTIYVVTLAVTKSSALVVSDVPVNQHQNVQLVDHETSSSLLLATSLYAKDRTAIRFNVQPSHNRQGGDQFTLAFTLKVNEFRQGNEGVLLLWGDKSYATFKSKSGEIRHLVTFMPHVQYRMTEDDTVFTVSFNTSESVNEQLIFRMSETNTHHLNSNEYLLVITFQDNDRYGPSNAVVAQAYIDENASRPHVCSGAVIRRNLGYIHVLPDAPLLKRDGRATGSAIAIKRLSYHNYAFTLRDIRMMKSGKMKFEGKIEGDASGVYDKVNDLTTHHLRNVHV